MNVGAQLPRRYFTVRYFTPGRYALEVLSDLAGHVAVLAVLRWFLPVCQVPGLASWPRPWQAAAVAVVAVSAAADVALLRVRRGRS